MSVFRVKLSNTVQGQLDIDPSTGLPMSTSIQRTVSITGPNGVTRVLADGDEFTDCNYYKRFAYPQMDLNHAILEVVTDDGSVYSSNPAENTFIKTYTLDVSGGTTYEDNEADILGDTGGFAVFTQITADGGDVLVRTNGVEGSEFTLADGNTQTFSNGDASISLVQIDNSASGAGDVDVTVIVSVRSVCNS